MLLFYCITIILCNTKHLNIQFKIKLKWVILIPHLLFLGSRFVRKDPSSEAFYVPIKNL